ncbi:hypothetical protein F5Y18DRAFT_406504 [Xylariaceae sp. FL1019]|nr:hypothetical protein F5Y18DRAFT_406504 [Xylariaceae sp. FL1019]
MPPGLLQSTTSGLSSSSSTESAKLDLADQREIEAIWKEVTAKVVELAGGDPKRIQQVSSIDDVLRHVESAQKTEDKKSAEWGTFKNILGKTLQCIQTIGSIVSNGVSNVFAPADMAFNALTFVISAWQGYEGTFVNLGELLEKCVDFFERLQSYQGKMDSRLTRLASQNLRLFVEICDRLIKLRKKHTRFLRFTKQLFLKDDGVQDLLSMMERLNSKEALLVSAQIYRLVSDSAGDMKLVIDAQKEMRREDDAKKWRRTIAKSLGFPGTTLDSDGEPIPAWQRAFDTRLNSLVEGTGSWWKSDDKFYRWATSADAEEAILLLSGPGGTGKTSMMANTIKSIRKLGSDAPPGTTRVITAYYFADADKRKVDDEDQSGFLERVSRTLLWQIATSYEAMTKSVNSALERAPLFDGSLDRWDRLFFNNKESLNPSTSFYVFIDAIDTELLPLLERFSKWAPQTKTRILLAGRPELIAQHFGRPERVRFTDIPIAERSGPDVEKFIIAQMNTMPILRDVSRSGIAAWRQIIQNELQDKCAGDFLKLNTSLNALSKVDLIEDIRDVLEKAGRTRLDQIDAELRRLNSTRTLKEIREINEIITWISTGRRYFKIEMLEALLSVKQHAPSFTNQNIRPGTLDQRQLSFQQNVSTSEANSHDVLTTISLLPLAQKLREKYTIFSVTDSGMVDWRSSEIPDRIPTLGHQQNVSIEGSDQTQRSNVIQESEINIIRHFLNNVCPGELYNRFDFEEFFNRKLGARLKEYISLDPDNANVRIVFTCLVVLTTEELRGKEKLRHYAMYWLLDHLQEVDLAAADRELKAQVGPLLIRLFTEDCGIDSLFWSFDLNVSMKTWEQGEATLLRESRIEWVFSTAGVREVARWLSDSSVTRYIASEVGLKLVEAIKAPNSNLHQVVLCYAAKRMAVHLFLRIEFLKRQFLSGCCFLIGYLARLNGVEMGDDPAMYRGANDVEYHTWEPNVDLQLSKLDEIEKWASTELALEDTPDQQSLWEIHGALLAFQLCDNEDEKKEVSQRRAQKALDLDPENWHACHFVSGRPSTSQQRGVELLSRAKTALDSIRTKDTSWMQDSANSALIARITLDLGNRLWEGGDFATAALKHRESLGYDYVHFTAYAKVLGRYRDSQKWDEIIAFIDTMNQTTSIWDAYFDELVHDFIAGLAEENSDMLAMAADITRRWDAVETFFTIAMDIGSQQKAYDLLFLLRDGFAKTLELSSGTIDENMVVSIRSAALESIKAHPSDVLPRTKIWEVTDSLARVYVDQAFRPNTSEEKVESLGSLLSTLVPDSADAIDSAEIVTVCYLIRYHHKRNSKSEVAQRWIRRIVSTGLELLSDSDEENDDYAYWLLAKLFTTIEDDENNQIVWTMRNALQSAALAKWSEWVTTPLDSPVRKRTFQSEQKNSQDSLSIRRRDSSQSVSSQPGGRSRSRGSAHSPQSEIPKHVDKPTQTSAAHPPDGTTQATAEQPHPSRISTDIVEVTPPSTPPKPTWFVGCAGCDKEWTLMDEPLYTSADTVGVEKLCGECYALLMKDQLPRKGLKSKKEHKFLDIPAWDEDRYGDMPHNCLPLPKSKDDTKRWILLEEWKESLRRLYLPEIGA